MHLWHIVIKTRCSQAPAPGLTEPEERVDRITEISRVRYFYLARILKLHFQLQLKTFTPARHNRTSTCLLTAPGCWSKLSLFQIFSVRVANWGVNIWHDSLEPLQHHQQPLVRIGSLHATGNWHYSKVNLGQNCWWVGNISQYWSFPRPLAQSTSLSA